MLETFNLMLLKKDGGGYGLPCTNVTWKTTRMAPVGTLQLSYLRESGVKVDMGDKISLGIDSTKDNTSPPLIFTGTVFRADYTQDSLIKVTAYDNLRYLKASSSYIWEAETLSQKLREICGEYSLEMGEIVDTGLPITEAYESKGMLDMLMTAMLETNSKTGVLHTLFTDGEGRICLKRTEDMKVTDPIIGDNSLMYGYSFSESIDENTFTAITVPQKDEEESTTKLGFAVDKGLVEKYGMLTMVKQADSGTATPQEWADALLANRKYPTLSLSQTSLGRLNVRAGVMLPVIVNDVGINNVYFIVDECTHTFERGVHTMQTKKYIPQAAYPAYR